MGTIKIKQNPKLSVHLHVFGNLVYFQHVGNFYNVAEIAELLAAMSTKQTELDNKE
jgi:hypothetical protein